MGYLSASLTQVFTHAGGTDVSLRDVTIAQMGNGATECGWRHAPEARGGFGGFWKSQFKLDTEREGSTFGARWGLTNLRATGAARDGEGANGKARMCISPYVEERLNSKAIKSFVPELRSNCFFVFRDSYVLCIYIYIYEHVRFAYPYLGYGTYLSIY